MAFVPVAPFQGRAGEQGGRARKARVVPPAFGAQAFHASESTGVNDTNGVGQSIPPPTRKNGSLGGGMGASSTSNVHFASPAGASASFSGFAPDSVPMTNSLPFSTMEVPATAVDARKEMFSTIASDTASSGVAPPPSGSRRETTGNGTQRTRRLAAPAASFAATGPLSAPPQFVPPASVLPPLAPPLTFQTEEQPLFMPSATHSTTTPAPPASETTFSPPEIISPSLSPSMFSPVGKGADLFDTKPQISNGTSQRISPTVPTTTADFFDFDDSAELTFGMAAPTPVKSNDVHHQEPPTTAQVVSKLFERTPSPVLPQNTFSPSVVHKPSFSASLFDDAYDDNTDDLFSSASQRVNAPQTDSFASTPSPAHVVQASPVTEKTDPFKPAVGATSIDSDLFEDDGKDLFNSAPNSARFAAPLAQVDSIPTQTDVNPQEDTFKPNGVPAPVLGEASHSEPVFMTPATSVPAELPPQSNLISASNSLEATQVATKPFEHVPVVSDHFASTAIATSDSLFDDASDDELDFGKDHSPIVAPQAAHDSKPAETFILPPVVSEAPFVPPTVVETMDSPSLDIPHEVEAPAKEEEVVKEDETPQFVDPTSLAFVQPPPSLGAGAKKSSTTSRSGPKRPRHFQYNSGQPISQPPGTSQLLAEGPPPIKSAHQSSLPSEAPPKMAFAAPPAALAVAPVFSPFVAPVMSEPFVAPEPMPSEPEESATKSIFNPLEQVKSKGLSWLKSAVSAVTSPGGPVEPQEDRETSQEPPFEPNGHTSHETLPFGADLKSVVASPPIPLPKVHSGFAAKKKKPVARPGPFKSVGDGTTNANDGIKLSSDAVLPPVTIDAAPVVSSPKPAPLSNSPVVMAASPLDDHPFNVSSGLVSIDYSTPPHSTRASLSNISDADPFGSDATVSATDFFSKLRSFASSDSLAPVQPAHPTTTNNSAPLSYEHPTLPTTTHSIQAGAEANSELSLSTASTASDLANNSLKQELDALKVQLKQANDELHSKTEEMTRLKSQLSFSTQQISSHLETEQQLRQQLSQLSLGHESSSQRALELEQASNLKNQEKLAQLQQTNASLTVRISELEEKVLGLERANGTLVREHSLKISQLESTAASAQTSATTLLETRIRELEKSLYEARDHEGEAARWKAKFESESATFKRARSEFDVKLSTLEEEYNEKLIAQARTAHSGKENETALAQLKSSLEQEKIDLKLDLERKHAEDVARIQSENERYVVLMQQQAASQTSVIDRLIHQNADLIKAVEFAKRVYQESKNPDSLSSMIADNDRLHEELEICETELSTLRQRNKDLEAKSTHFESECEELLKRLSSIDYRLLMSTQSPVASSSPFGAPTSSVSAEAAPIETPQSSVSNNPPPTSSPAVEPISSAQKAIVGSPSMEEWQPKSPILASTFISDSPGKTPSRFVHGPGNTSANSAQTSLMPPETKTTTPQIAAPFVVTGPIVTHPTESMPGLQHAALSPQINLNDLDHDDTVQAELGDFAQKSPQHANATPSRALKIPPARGIVGRIWQAVTLQ